MTLIILGLLGQFGYLTSPSEMGFVFENFVFLLLKTRLAHGLSSLHFWRTKDKAEVDFIVERGKDIIPIEVKYKYLKKEEVPRSLRSFIERYSPPEAYIINLNLSTDLKIGDTKLVFIPYYDLLSRRL